MKIQIFIELNRQGGTNEPKGSSTTVFEMSEPCLPGGNGRQARKRMGSHSAKSKPIQHAYSIGTIASALIIGRAGIWFDKYGARIVALFAALTLGIAFFLSLWSFQMSTFVKNVLEIDSWIIAQSLGYVVV